MNVRMRSARPGFILLAALWITLAASALALAVSTAGRRALAAAANRADATAGLWAAEGCMSGALAALHTASLDDPVTWSALDSVLESAPPPLPCVVTARPVGERADVNAVDSAFLRRLADAAGIRGGRGDSIVAAILDWRDGDSVARPLGAERDWYRERDRQLPRDGALAHQDELLRVRGVGHVPALLDYLGAEPGRIALSHAPAAVLAALPGLDDTSVRRLIRARRQAPVDLRRLAAALPAGSRATIDRAWTRLVGMAVPVPDAWMIEARAPRGTPPLSVMVEVRLGRSGGRSVIERRRDWIE